MNTDAPQETTETPSVSEIPEVETPNAEAAKYRTRLRETEAQRDALAAELAAYHDAELDRLAAQPVQAPIEGFREPTEDDVALYRDRFGEGVPWVKPYTLRHPEDLFTVGGVDRASLLDDTGRPDPHKVQVALKDLRTARPELFTTPPEPVPSIGMSPADRVTAEAMPWQAVLQGTGGQR